MKEYTCRVHSLISSILKLSASILRLNETIEGINPYSLANKNPLSRFPFKNWRALFYATKSTADFAEASGRKLRRTLANRAGELRKPHIQLSRWQPGRKNGDTEGWRMKGVRVRRGWALVPIASRGSVMSRARPDAMKLVGAVYEMRLTRVQQYGILAVQKLAAVA